MRPIRARQRRDPVTGKRYPWLCQERAMVNHCLREIPLGLAVAADRSDYLGGFERTMLTHIDGSASAQSVLGHSWYWAQSKAFSSD